MSKKNNNNRHPEPKGKAMENGNDRVNGHKVVASAMMILPTEKTVYLGAHTSDEKGAFEWLNEQAKGWWDKVREYDPEATLDPASMHYDAAGAGDDVPAELTPDRSTNVLVANPEDPKNMFEFIYATSQG